jgi:hypothetical protein
VVTALRLWHDGAIGRTEGVRPRGLVSRRHLGRVCGDRSIVTQLARMAGAYVIGTGRAADRQKALDFGAQEFVDLENDILDDVGGVDLAFDLIGGDIGKRSASPDCPISTADVELSPFGEARTA